MHTVNAMATRSTAIRPASCMDGLGNTGVVTTFYPGGAEYVSAATAVTPETRYTLNQGGQSVALCVRPMPCLSARTV